MVDGNKVFLLRRHNPTLPSRRVSASRSMSLEWDADPNRPSAMPQFSTSNRPETGLVKFMVHTIRRENGINDSPRPGIAGRVFQRNPDTVNTVSGRISAIRSRFIDTE
jgi:hypothetical protein